MSSQAEWRRYEEEIYEMLRAKAEPGALVSFDAKLPGLLSGTKRQVDVYVEGEFAGGLMPRPLRMVVDCKHWSSTVNVDDVGKFVDLVSDVGADLGLLVTTAGFSPAAQTRALHAGGVQVEVITFEQLAAWQPTFASCQVCEVDPESDAMPGMMFLERYAPQGEVSSELIYVGMCDRCQAVHIRCECGAETGVYEAEEGEAFECSGGCGQMYSVDPIALDSSAVPLNDNPHDRVRVLAPRVGPDAG
jgi:hypothetical protein